MSSENIKEQIQQESENKKEIVQVLDVCRSEIIKLIKPFVKEELEKIVLNQVKQKPEHTKELGMDNLKTMKQRLTNLLEQSDELVDSIYANDEFWLHVNYLTGSVDDSLGQSWSNVREAEKQIHRGIKIILGKSGKIIIDYAYEKSGTKYERTGQWQQDDEYGIVYGSNYMILLPKELENKINEYCSQLRKLCECVEKKVGLEQELSREEAMELWEQV